MTTTSRDRLLTGIGLLAFTLYVLACRPAFSPDGTKLLVPIHDAAHTNTAVWVYDRVQQIWTKVFAANDLGLPSLAWTGDGQEAVIAWGTDSNQLHVVAAPLFPAGPARRYALDTQDKTDGAFIWGGPPVVGRFFYYADSNLVYRLDLRDGAVTTGRVTALVAVLPHARGLAALNEHHVGLLDPERLTFSPLQTTTNGPFACVVGNRVICGEQRQFTVFQNGKPERELTFDKDLELLDLAGGSRDDMVFATALRTKNELCVGEIPLGEGAPRWTKLCNTTTNESDSKLLLRLAVAPDNKSLALSTGLLTTGIAAADRALYLVDLTGPERKITKVPLPVPPPAKQ